MECPAQGSQVCPENRSKSLFLNVFALQRDCWLFRVTDVTILMPMCRVNYASEEAFWNTCRNPPETVVRFAFKRRWGMYDHGAEVLRKPTIHSQSLPGRVQKVDSLTQMCLDSALQWRRDLALCLHRANH